MKETAVSSVQVSAQYTPDAALENFFLENSSFKALQSRCSRDVTEAARLQGFLEAVFILQEIQRQIWKLWDLEYRSESRGILPMKTLESMGPG